MPIFVRKLIYVGPLNGIIRGANKQKSKGDLRYSTGGLGVRWVVAIDSTRVRVPAGALFLLYSVFLSYFMENTIG